MEPLEALRLVGAWGLVFIVACIFVGVGISFIVDAFKRNSDL